MIQVLLAQQLRQEPANYLHLSFFYIKHQLNFNLNLLALRWDLFVSFYFIFDSILVLFYHYQTYLLYHHDPPTLRISFRPQRPQSASEPLYASPCIASLSIAASLEQARIKLFKAHQSFT